MPTLLGRAMRALLAAGVLVGASHVMLRAQTQSPPAPAPLPTETPQIRFNSGQNVVPYFEGWIKNPDGTFDKLVTRNSSSSIQNYEQISLNGLAAGTYIVEVYSPVKAKNSYTLTIDPP